MHLTHVLHFSFTLFSYLLTTYNDLSSKPLVSFSGNTGLPLTDVEFVGLVVVEALLLAVGVVLVVVPFMFPSEAPPVLKGTAYISVQNFKQPLTVSSCVQKLIFLYNVSTIQCNAIQYISNLFFFTYKLRFKLQLLFI